jgi:hypothetical protein
MGAFSTTLAMIVLAGGIGVVGAAGVRLAGWPVWAVVALCAGSAGLIWTISVIMRVESRVMCSLRSPACAVCFRALDGIEADGDGCVTCPGCGAGWDLRDRGLDHRTVEDGRGLTRRLFDATSAPWRTLDLEPDLRQTSLGGRWVSWGVVLIGAAGAMSAVGGTVYVLLVGRAGWGAWGAGAAGLGTFLFAWWAREYVLPSRGKRAFVERFLWHRRCPSCAYGIGHAEAEADGCVVCPECGAAWKIDG